MTDPIEVVREARTWLDEHEVNHGPEFQSPKVFKEAERFAQAVLHLEAELAQAARYREALERLAKIDPIDERDLPFIDPTREFEARIVFAAAALTGETELPDPDVHGGVPAERIRKPANYVGAAGAEHVTGETEPPFDREMDQ